MFSRQKSRIGMHRGHLLLCVAAMSFGWSLSAHAKATFTTFDPPQGDSTNPTSINNGAITGYYYTTNAHGFLRTADGTITTFDPPNSKGTYPRGINHTGAVTGYSASRKGEHHGFVRAADGTIKTFDVRGAALTEGRDINKKGEVAGTYDDNIDGGNCGSASQCHGFVRNPKGHITTFDVPNSTQTFALKLNDRGGVVGSYDDSSGVQHAFMRSAEGTFTTIDPPGSTYTYGNGINNRGVVAGGYTDAIGSHGFVWNTDETYVTFDPPGCDNYVNVRGIDEQGRVTGVCNGDDFVQHGFEVLKSGRITVFDPPNSVRTTATSINGGEIIGQYTVGEDVHGYLRTK